MTDPVRRLRWQSADELLEREWLVANGLGGYSTGTVVGVCTRRYHGLLVAALPAPLGRVVMLSHLSELVRLPSGRTVRIGGEESARALELHGAGHLAEFRLELGLPVWRYDLGGTVIEKRLHMGHLENAVYVSYRLLEGERVRLKLRPSVHFRHHEGRVDGPHPGPYDVTACEERFEVRAPGPFPALRMRLEGAERAFTIDAKRLPEIVYRIEGSLGYESAGELWSPGYFRVALGRGEDAALVAGTETWEALLAYRAPEALAAERARRARLIEAADPAAREGVGAELVLAADQFVITPASRLGDAARARAQGDEAKSVIAGYHWFTDWGRDTMISLEGLTLATGRHAEAGAILRTFAGYVRDGLIPNLFPDGKTTGLYHTADATLWFFHALRRYVDVTGDRSTLRRLLPVLEDIVRHHVRGTRFGIGVDPGDGLLRQGEAGYQLTWMDAKVGDWVVTPRRGKAVEINALWYNALRNLEAWVRAEGGDASPHEALADQARRSFNERFWNPETGHLHDVVDGESGDDPACRPNQVLAIALENPVLEASRWHAVLEVVQRRLVTPVGLRSLAPGHPDYKRDYHGDLRTRDAAYHQGTVWSWLIGPWVDAWLRANPGDREGARRFLGGLAEHLGEAGIGQVSEIFDAEPPHEARGCIAQAWGVGELLRCWVKTAPSLEVASARTASRTPETTSE